jgi:exosortase
MVSMVSLPSSAAALPLKNWIWNRSNILAVAAAAVMCWGLLDAVLYCDTSYRATFGANRCTLVGLFISTFYGDIRDMITGLWQAAPTTSLAGEVTATEWTQCLFVPFIVGWMVYWLWPRLRELPVRGSSQGFVLLGAGLAFYLLGYLAENYYIGVVSMQFVYAGLIVLFLGWRFMRALFFPWAFLLFMWPYGFFEDVAFQLRMIMSDLSHHVLTLIGVPNVLNGSAILSPPNQTPPFAIDIADPCSGIRSLFALVMMAALAAFFLFNRAWQMIAIIAASVPLVIFGNLVRIVILTLATIHFGEKFALGLNDHPSWFHEGAGYAVYLINFASLIGFGWLLTKLSPDRPKQPETAESTTAGKAEKRK